MLQDGRGGGVIELKTTSLAVGMAYLPVAVLAWPLVSFSG